MRRNFTFALSCFLLYSATMAASFAQEHSKDSLETVKKNLADKKAVLLDVREQKEWDDGHLQPALLLPLSKLKEKGDAKSVLKAEDAKKIIYCHCRAGGRALTAAKLLQEQGYDVRPLKQGYEELLKAGIPKAASDNGK